MGAGARAGRRRFNTTCHLQQKQMEHSSILFSSSSYSSISFTPFLPSLYHFLHFLCLLSSSFRALFGPLHQSVHLSYSCSDVGGYLLFGIVCNIYHFTLSPKCSSSMPQVSDFIGENTDIWNFNGI